MFVLDTNVLSELRRPRPHGGVVNWLEALPEDQIFISAVTLGELQRGVELLRAEDSLKAAAIDAWIDLVIGTYTVLPMDAKTFRAHAQLMHRRPYHIFEDAMIAATAQVLGYTVATRDTSDFAKLGVKTFNPFKGGQT